MCIVHLFALLLFHQLSTVHFVCVCVAGAIECCLLLPVPDVLNGRHATHNGAAEEVELVVRELFLLINADLCMQTMGRRRREFSPCVPNVHKKKKNGLLLLLLLL